MTETENRCTNTIIIIGQFEKSRFHYERKYTKLPYGELDKINKNWFSRPLCSDISEFTTCDAASSTTRCEF